MIDGMKLKLTLTTNNIQFIFYLKKKKKKTLLASLGLVGVGHVSWVDKNYI